MNGHLPSPFIYKCPYTKCKFNGSQRKELLSAHLRECHTNDEKLGCVTRLSLDGEAALAEQRRLMNEAQTFALFDCISRGDIDELNKFFVDHASARLTAQKSAAIHVCITKGHQNLIWPLLQHGVDIDMLDRNDGTALYLASKQKNYGAVKMLLGYGANVNAVSRKGYTPLHHAAMNGDETLVGLIISAKPDYEVNSLHAHHHNGFLREGTALHYAVARGHVGTVKLLLAGGACADSVKTFRETPLHLATKAGHLDIAKLLLAGGASVDSSTKSSETPLHFAAEGRHEDIARLLLASGAGVDSLTSGEKTPLHCAALVGHESIARLLLASGAGVDSLTRRGETPLHFAAENGHENVARLLLAGGAGVDSLTRWGETPLHFAAKKGHENVARLLLAAGAKTEPTEVPAGYAHEPPLHRAVRGGHIALARLLLEGGARVNYSKDYNYQTPLHYAAARQDPELINILLEANAQVDSKTRYGLTSLAYAIRKRVCVWESEKDTREESTKLLLAAGAKFSLYDWNYLSTECKNMFALYRPAEAEQSVTSDPAIIPWIAESEEKYADIARRYRERGTGQ